MPLVFIFGVVEIVDRLDHWVISYSAAQISDFALQIGIRASRPVQRLFQPCQIPQRITVVEALQIMELLDLMERRILAHGR